MQAPRFLFGFLAAAVLALGFAPSMAAAAPMTEPSYHQDWPPGLDLFATLPAIAAAPAAEREDRVSPASIGADQPDPAGVTALRQTHAGRYALAHRADRDRWRHRLE
jgi:hypothetical protein